MTTPRATGPEDGPIDLVRHEERLRTGSQTKQVGSVRASKHADVDNIRQVVSRGVEHADVEREAVLEGDSGQVETLPDGSVSIPVFEEQLVIEKRLVVRERVILRKHTVYEEHVVTTDLRRERIEVHGDRNVEVTEARRPRPTPGDGAPPAV